MIVKADIHQRFHIYIIIIRSMLVTVSKLTWTILLRKAMYEFVTERTGYFYCNEYLVTTMT